MVRWLVRAGKGVLAVIALLIWLQAVTALPAWLASVGNDMASLGGTTLVRVLLLLLGFLLLLVVVGPERLKAWLPRSAPPPTPAPFPPVATEHTETVAPSSIPPVVGRLKAAGTNRDEYPRIESAVDSFGHAAKRVSNHLSANTGYVLRPGKQVGFELSVTDPKGEDVTVRVTTPARLEAAVTMKAGVIVWTVTEKDVSDPAQVTIDVESQRNYRRVLTWDDSVTFFYRVLPR